MWIWSACRPGVSALETLGPGVEVSYPDTWETDCGGDPSTTDTSPSCTWVMDYAAGPPGSPQLRAFGPGGCLREVSEVGGIVEIEPDGTRWVYDGAPDRFHREDPDGAVTNYRLHVRGAFSAWLWEVARLPDGSVLGLVVADYDNSSTYYSAPDTLVDRWGADGTWLERWYAGGYSYRADLEVGSDGAAWLLRGDPDGRLWRLSAPVDGATSAELVTELDEWPLALAVSSDGEALVLLDDTVRLLGVSGDGATRVVVDGGHDSLPGDLDLAPDGTMVITDIARDRVLVVEPDTGTLLSDFATGLDLHVGGRVNVAPCP